MSDSESGSADEPRTLRRRLPREDRRRLAAANEQEWLAFPGLPGTHLTWRKSGSGNWDLVSAEGAIWATRRGKSVVASDRIYEICRIRTNDSFINPRYRTELVDSAGSAVFSWTGTHSAGHARTVLSLGGVDYEFPLRGSMYKTKTVMSAVETGEPGLPLAQFRLTSGWYRAGLSWSYFPPRSVEVVVSPGFPMIPQMALVIAVASPWLRSYFRGNSG